MTNVNRQPLIFRQPSTSVDIQRHAGEKALRDYNLLIIAGLLHGGDSGSRTLVKSQVCLVFSKTIISVLTVAGRHL